MVVNVAKMSVRSTYALDEETSNKIKHLAKTWHVSQAEVIRRSVRTAAEQVENALSPADVVAYYRKTLSSRSRADIQKLVKAARAWRHEDDERRMAR